VTKKKPERKIRITLDVSQDFYARLEALEGRVNAPSKASVIRDALQLYEYIADRQKAGWRFEATAPSGEKEHPVFLNLPS
jgi:hypothetical protein